MLHAKMVALPCFPFELSPLNNSIMLGQDIVLHAKMVALPCVLFELSPLMHKQCVFHSFHSLSDDLIIQGRIQDFLTEGSNWQMVGSIRKLYLICH